MKLYFSGISAFREDKDLIALVYNPMVDYITTKDGYVKIGKLKKKIDDTSIQVPAVEDRSLIPDLRRKGKNFHLVGVTSPAELINLRPFTAECIIDKDNYILPNGSKHSGKMQIQSFVKRWGEDKEVFNRKSFEKAAKMAENRELKLKKYKGKSKNPFFDPKVVEKASKVNKMGVKADRPGVLAIRNKNEVISSTLTCDSCAYKEKCPGYMENSVCSYSDNFKYLVSKIKSRDIDLITDSIQEIIANESERYAMARHFEKVSGNIDGRTTQIGDFLFKKLIEFVKLVKPELDNRVTYNILNQQVNIGTAVEKLEDAGLSEDQRQGLAEQIDQILKEEKQKRATGTKVVVNP